MPAEALPDTDNEESVPTDVMFGCDAVVNEPATVEKDPSAPETFPVETLPETVKAPVVLLNVKLVLPANEPPSLNWTWVLLPPAFAKVYGVPFA